MIDFFKGTVTRKDWMAVGVILGCTLLVAAIFIFLVHAEQKKKLMAVQSELSTQEGELAKARNTERNIAKLREETNKVRTLVKAFEERLPDKRDMPELLEQFEQMAHDVGLEVTLTSQDAIVDQNKETIPYEVAVRGNFHQIVGFVNQLERHKRYLSVSNLNISEQKDGISEAKFTLSTYSFRQQGPGPAAVPAGTAPEAKAEGAA